MNALRRKSRWLRLLQCPLCSRKLRFNWWWVADVDTYFYCPHCGVRLAQISFVVVALMVTFAAGQLFNLYQTLSASHENPAAIVIKRAVLYFAAISCIRVGLLFILFMLKFPKILFGKKDKQPAQEIWWEPFAKG